MVTAYLSYRYTPRMVTAVFTYIHPMHIWWQASHLFTCASDPVETSYKRFAFPADTAAATPAGGCAHRSRELWDEWRGIALRGGLEVLLKETGSGNGP